MWLKNLNVYRLRDWHMSAATLAENLAPQAFQPCPSNALASSGWTPPREGGNLVHAVEGQYLLHLTTEAKLLPAGAVNIVVNARAKELEEQHGFPPGKRARKELKERVTDELLPRALTTMRRTSVWIDSRNGWLVVDGSHNRADEVIKLLLRAVDRLPLESLRVQRSPLGAMTEWLQDDEAPAGFTVDMTATLRAAGEGRAQVKYTRHSLDPEEVRRHIAAGKQCHELAMTWESKVSFTLNDSLTIKGIAPLDVLRENIAPGQTGDERLDGDFLLMAGELHGMLRDLVEALGGFAVDDNGDLYTAEEAENDPLYEQAVKVVHKNGRASISLVQRHLRIGYNQAAHLIEMMEKLRIVSPMDASGNRKLISGE